MSEEATKRRLQTVAAQPQQAVVVAEQSHDLAPLPAGDVAGAVGALAAAIQGMDADDISVEIDQDGNTTRFRLRAYRRAER